MKSKRSVLSWCIQWWLIKKGWSALFLSPECYSLSSLVLSIKLLALQWGGDVVSMGFSAPKTEWVGGWQDYSLYSTGLCSHSTSKGNYWLHIFTTVFSGGFEGKMNWSPITLFCTIPPSSVIVSPWARQQGSLHKQRRGSWCLFVQEAIAQAYVTHEECQSWLPALGEMLRDKAEAVRKAEGRRKAI